MQQPEGHFLAQVNVARALDPLDSPRLAGFMAALERVNAVADRSPGFVWRLRDDIGAGATALRVNDDPLFIVNLSVWETAEALGQFVWNTIHKKVYARKSDWFEAMTTPHLAMWWIPAQDRPTPAEAMERLAELSAGGPSARVFGWESLPEIRLWMSRRCA